MPRRREKLGDLCLAAVASPTFGCALVAVITDRQVDAFGDEVLDLFEPAVVRTLMQDAGRLVGAPAGVDVGAAVKQEIGDFVLAIDHGPGQSAIEDILHRYVWEVVRKRVVPIGLDEQGLPIGFQVMAPALGETTMFQVAAEVERLAVFTARPQMDELAT